MKANAMLDVLLRIWGISFWDASRMWLASLYSHIAPLIPTGPARLWPFSLPWITAGDLLQRTDIIMYNTQRNNWRYHTSCLMHWLGSLSPYQQCFGESRYLNIPKGQSSIKGMWREIKHVAYHSLREPMSPALDEGSVILVSSVAHLRDGNRAFKVWNEHSSSVLPSRWGKGIKKRWWHFQ